MEKNFAGSRHPATRIRLLRHATLLVEIGGKKLLVDPMLSKKDALDPVQHVANADRIPMVDLPLPDQELLHLLGNIDAVLVTHIHRDHWDIAAQQLIDKKTLIICQPADETKISEQGFIRVRPVPERLIWNDTVIYRTNGQHGTGEVGKKMGTVSGFVLDYQDERIYIAGDTIWCSDVEEAIRAHNPTLIVVNGGGAQFLQGGPITMTTDDVVQLCQFYPGHIAVVHLETVNHCRQRRSAFKAAAEKHRLSERVHIPSDGDWINR